MPSSPNGGRHSLHFDPFRPAVLWYRALGEAAQLGGGCARTSKSGRVAASSQPLQEKR